MSSNDNRKCETCRFLVAGGGDSPYWGKCHRMPPGRDWFPTVARVDWCGEWSAADVTERASVGTMDEVLASRVADPFQLKLEMSAFNHTEQEIEAALAGLHDAGAIERRNDGTVYLPNWKEWGHRAEPAMTATERSQKHRATKCNVVQRDATLRNVAQRDATKNRTRTRTELEQKETRTDSERARAPVPPDSASPVLDPAPESPTAANTVPRIASEPKSAAEDTPPPKSITEHSPPPAVTVPLAGELTDIGWGNSNRQRIREAERLAGQGMTAAHLAELWRRAHGPTVKSPIRVLSAALQSEAKWRDALGDWRPPDSGSRAPPRAGGSRDIGRVIGSVLDGARDAAGGG